MKTASDDRQMLLEALLDYADESRRFNPHFYRREMTERLGVTDGEFNVMQNRLGDGYCRFVDYHDGDNRYMIDVSECLSLRDQFRQNKIQEERHRQLVRLSVLVAVLGAVLATALAIWFL